jgi:hypothetical protein
MDTYRDPLDDLKTNKDESTKKAIDAAYERGKQEGKKRPTTNSTFVTSKIPQPKPNG